MPVHSATDTVYSADTASEINIGAGFYYVVVIGNDTGNKYVDGFQIPDASMTGISGKYVALGISTETAGTLPSTFDPTSLTATGSVSIILRLDN